MKKVSSMLLVAVLALSMAVLVGCGGGSDVPVDPATDKPSAPLAAGIPADKIKVGFVYVGPIGDEGYTFAHNQGRLQLEKELGVETVYLEDIKDNAADTEKALRDLIDQGCNVIYATSFGYMDFVAKIAKEFPDIYFGHATGYTTDKNLSVYMGRIYEPRYLSGIAAGMKTTAKKIGYVAAYPIPEVVRGLNAFTLGVRSVNPEATVEVIWTNNWYDPSGEKAAAVELLNKGCDVIAQHCDTTGPQVAAAEKGAFCVGYNATTLSAAPNAYLTSPLFHWGNFYVDDVKSVIDGTWTSRDYWEGLKSGMVSLDTLSANCAAGTQEAVADAQAKIENGELFVFSGPLKDNTGAEKVAAGAKMTDQEMLSFDWLVEGVIGTIK